MPLRTPETLWYAQDAGPLVSLGRAALWPATGAWWAATHVHRALYQAGLLKPSFVEGARIVAVGNVVVGGAGKTPTVLALAQAAVAAGLRPAVVCRGYGARPGPQGTRVERDTPVDVCGDEPLLLARALDGVPVFSGVDRAVLARAAVAQGCNLVLLDDGMQHHRVHRDALVAVVRGEHPFGNGWLLPAGPLREGAGALRRAQLVVALEGTPGTVAQLVAHGVDPAVVALARLRALDPVPLDGAGPVTLAGARVVVAAGLARPSRVAHTVAALGAQVAGTLAWPDHAGLDRRRVEEALDLAVRHQASTLVITEKDAVKWVPPGSTRGVRVAALPVRLEWDGGVVPPRLHAVLGTPASSV